MFWPGVSLAFLARPIEEKDHESGRTISRRDLILFDQRIAASSGPVSKWL